MTQKILASFNLPKDLVDSVRDAVVALSGPPYRMTMARFAEEALTHKLGELRDQANKGKPFPKRNTEMKGGRPIK